MADNAAQPGGVDGGPRTPLELFAGLTEDEWLLANTAGFEAYADVLPALPDENLQHQFTGKAGDDTLAEGHTLARAFKDLYRQHVGPLTPDTRVLDYGCGWGRITRFFLKDVTGASLHGIDCNARLIELCQESNPWARFELNDPLPPTTFPDASFDLAYSYSVFTHLREDVHLAWIDELRRLVRPGGLVILTVRPRGFISYCAKLTAESELSHRSQNSLVGLFAAPDDALADYDAGRFVYVPYPKTSYGDWWGEACIGRGYVDRVWSTRFEVLDFIEDPARFKQHLVVLRVPA